MRREEMQSGEKRDILGEREKRESVYHKSSWEVHLDLEMKKVREKGIERRSVTLGRGADSTLLSGRVESRRHWSEGRRRE
jgi:hypothetical protein